MADLRFVRCYFFDGTQDVHGDVPEDYVVLGLRRGSQPMVVKLPGNARTFSLDRAKEMEAYPVALMVLPREDVEIWLDIDQACIDTLVDSLQRLEARVSCAGSA
jgi:hypothetical protein